MYPVFPDLSFERFLLVKLQISMIFIQLEVIPKLLPSSS